MRRLGAGKGDDEDEGGEEGKDEVKASEEEEVEGVAELGRGDDFAAGDLTGEEETARVEPSCAADPRAGKSFFVVAVVACGGRGEGFRRGGRADADFAVG